MLPVLVTAGDPMLAEVSYSVSPSNIKKSSCFAATWLASAYGRIRPSQSPLNAKRSDAFAFASGAVLNRPTMLGAGAPGA